MCSSGSNYEPTPVPKAVPGATSVAAGSPEDSLLNLSRVRASQRKRRGAASTVRNEGFMRMRSAMGVPSGSL